VQDESYLRMMEETVEGFNKLNQELEAALTPFADAYAALINPEFGGEMQDLINEDHYKRAYEVVYQPERFKDVKE
jgi:hypothetical protein